MADFTSHVRKALLLYRRKRHASSNHTTGAPHVTRTLYTVYSPVSAVLMAGIGTASKIGTQVRYNERAQLACQEEIFLIQVRLYNGPTAEAEDYVATTVQLGHPQLLQLS